MWLLQADVKHSIEQALSAGFMPTAEQQERLTAAHISAASEGGSRVLTVAGNVAEIEIKGTLTNSPSFLAMFFGGGNTTYPEIIAAVAEAEQDPTVTETILAFKTSPGGSIDGMFDAIAAIKNATKPIKATVSNLCASAAYALASQADEIVADNQAARIGSIGIAASFTLDENEVSITSTNAPKKRPDVTTEAGKAVVREELDAIENLFTEALAEGRGVTQEKIIADFGQGAVVLAKDALTRGMIDSVATSLSVVPSTNSTTAHNTGGNQLEATTMDLKELVAQHPEAYQAAVQQGVDQERDRVGAHLTMGEASGDTKTAFAAIKDGSGMTATLQATYMTAGMNKSDIAARDDDNTDVTATNEDPAPEAGADVAALVEAKLGVEV